jgi:hypothetical protein
MRWGIASAALQTHDWSSLLIPPSALGLGIAARGQLAGKTTLSASPAPLPQNMAPLDPQLWLAPRPSEAVNRQELQPLSPRLFLRPLPVSRIALENASHVLAVGQITLEPLPSLGVNPSFLPQLNTVLDGATAVVAVAEIIQESTRPTLHGVKRLLYYLKRLLYLTKFITDVVPVAPTVQHTFTVVGLVVKGTDELHSVKLKASRMQKLA